MKVDLVSNEEAMCLAKSIRGIIKVSGLESKLNPTCTYLPYI